MVITAHHAAPALQVAVARCTAEKWLARDVGVLTFTTGFCQHLMLRLRAPVVK